MKHINLFPTPLLQTNLGLDSALLLNELKNDWQMKWVFEEFSEGSELQKFKQGVCNAVHTYFENVGYTNVDLVPVAVWYNENQKGQHTVPHHHGMSLVSWTYYVDVPNKSGDIIFLDPKGNNSWDFFKTGYKLDKSDVPKLMHPITPQNGELLVFPGWITHYVEPNQNERCRRSISGDFHSKTMFDCYMSSVNGKEPKVAGDESKHDFFDKYKDNGKKGRFLSSD